MTETLLLALLVCKIKGYKLKPLFKSWAFYPILFMECVYIILEISTFMGNYSFVKYAGLFKLLYLYAYLILIIKYKRYFQGAFGAVFIIIGSALNKLVIYANNGKMPVFPSFSYYTGYVKKGITNYNDGLHIFGDSSVKLKFLSDIFDVGYSILSLGDIFIRFFVFIVVVSTIKTLNETL
ncbi:DUF5317 family protein [Clostridium grantii]|uniref:Uncharacterized protein n=1 Tax=Clostridium grantii DSM 8605 TaxID=1121316 RepID=A0A1M5QKE7_9CLOT|nr:DUF5317 family protein [Clostridium grantii]SHH14386.1 hypothetical protein SAMN02745207_00145 [Clostridium grantii DSM 8605]